MRIDGFCVFAFLLLVGCGAKAVKATVEDPETTPDQTVIDMLVVESKNGSKTYRMSAPLMEHYGLAKEPFSEFTKGVLVETFSDTTKEVQSDLVADYARFDEKKEIWVVRGNVIGRNIVEDKTLYTEELFWDQKKDKIYTEKFARLVDGNSQHRGTGFESDGQFKFWTFRSTSGKMAVSPTDSTELADSTQTIEGAKTK